MSADELKIVQVMRKALQAALEHLDDDDPVCLEDYTREVVTEALLLSEALV